MSVSDLNNVRAITPGASAIVPRPQALYVSVGGNVTIANDDGTTATIAVVAGSLLRIRPHKVTAATATVFACD